MDVMLNKAQSDFEQLLSGIPAQHVSAFLRWVKHKAENDLEQESPSNEDIVLDQIKDDLRQALPADAMYQSENIVFPIVGENADCKPDTTLHVDSFLYDEDQVDDLCDNGKMSRNYCTSCGSKATAPCTFLSHSVSTTKLKYMYKFLLPDLRGKTVLDVGSRLGAVLFGGYYYSGASSLVGVEMNKDLCQLQQSIVDKYSLSDRVRIVCSDICQQAQIVASADVIVLHNVFEFFMPADAQRKIWQFLHNTARKSGCLIAISPSLPQCMEHLDTGIDISRWVRPVEISDKLHNANLYLFGDLDSDDSDLADIHLYEVLPTY